MSDTPSPPEQHDGRSPRSRRRANDLTTELPAFLTGQLDRVEAPPHDLSDDDLDTVAALGELGVPEADAVAAVRGGRVALVLAQRVLDEVPVYSHERTSRKSGVPVDFLAEIQVAMGLAVPERYSRSDLEWARGLGDLLEVLDPEAVLRSGRARGQALARIVAADMGVIRDELILPLRQAGADDLSVAVALSEAVQAMQPIAEQLLVSAYRMHVRRMLQSQLALEFTQAAQAEITLAVGFVDLVGYTTLAEQIDPEGLGDVLTSFETRVVDVVATDAEVGIVKYLGDAAMLVGPDVPTLARVMLELVQPTTELADVPIRGGLASGQILMREGDYFGAPVNLAARLTDASRPWRLLADEHSGAVLADHGFDTHGVRSIRLRGIGSVKPVAVLGPPPSDEAA